MLDTETMKYVSLSLIILREWEHCVGFNIVISLTGIRWNDLEEGIMDSYLFSTLLFDLLCSCLVFSSKSLLKNLILFSPFKRINLLWFYFPPAEKKQKGDSKVIAKLTRFKGNDIGHLQKRGIVKKIDII